MQNAAVMGAPGSPPFYSGQAPPNRPVQIGQPVLQPQPNINQQYEKLNQPPPGSYLKGMANQSPYQQPPMQAEYYPQPPLTQSMQSTVPINRQNVPNVQRPPPGIAPQTSNPNLASQLSQKSRGEGNLSRLNSSKLNRTIVNELLDPES